MPDIFDTIQKKPSGDIFDQVSKQTDIFDQISQPEEGWIKPSLEEIGRGIAATPETAAQLATGFAATPIAGLAGLGKLLTTGSLEEATKTIGNVARALTYQPRQKTAQEATALAMKPIEWMQKARDIVGDYVFKETGNPYWAASAATAFELGSYLLPGKVGGMMIPKTIPELKPWDAKISPEAFVDMQRKRILQNIKDSKAIPERPLRDLAIKERQLAGIKKARSFKKLIRVGNIEYDKPQGLYLAKKGSPITEGLPGKTTELEVNPRKPLIVEKELLVRHQRGRGFTVPASSGIKALRKLVGADEFNRLIKLDKTSLSAELSAKYPKINWKRYTDAYEMLEGYAGKLARERGYDSIIGDPDEIVVLDKSILRANGMKRVPRGSNLLPVARKLAIKGKAEVPTETVKPPETGIKAYHGTQKVFTRFAPTEKPELVPVDRAIGPHFAVDPKVAESFTKDKYGKEFVRGGNIIPVRLDIKNPYVIPQPRYPSGNLMSDQVAIAIDIARQVFPKRKDLFIEWVKRSRNVDTKTANKIYETLKAGKAPTEKIAGPFADSERTNFGDYVADMDPGLVMMMRDKNVELANEYKKILLKKGYDGIQYQNTAPMETKGAEDVTSFIPLKKGQVKSDLSDVTLSFMGTQQAYEKAIQGIKWLKDAAVAFSEGVHDAIDVEAPLKRMGAPKTAFARKNMFSKMAKEEELGLYEARQNAKLFNFDKKVAPDVVLSAEDPQYFNQLPKEVRSKIKPAVRDLDKYFKRSQMQYAKRGIRLDFKQRILNDLNNLIDAAEKQGIKKPEAARKLKELKEARAIAERMNFVHIPSAMWFKDFLGKDPAGASRALKLLATQKRKSLTIKSLIDRGLINKDDIHPADIIASYARRKGRDFAILDFVDAARKEGLASFKKEPDMVQVPGYIAPVLAKYWLKKPLADIVYDMSRMDRMSKFDKVVAITKMMQFYNPLFLPMYDVVQQVMLVGPHIYKMPKYWKQGIKDVWNKTPEYWRALDKGIASKPFNAPWDEFQESLKYAKMSNPEIANALASEFFSPKMLKTIYHGSWRIAWELDKTVRMVSNRYLLDQGFSPEEAAQIAAKFHSDYASVPPAMRRVLNKVFFTPTFKITMGKLYGNMIKDALKGVVKGGRIDPRSKAFARGLINTFAILEAYDLFMTKGLGFKRDEWGRRYVKTDVDTPEGKKELVSTWSAPVNMFLKYLYRAQIAARQGELTQKVRSFIEMNKWEFHPIWRTLYDEFWTNKTPSGDQIVNPFDSPMTKAIKRIKYFTKSMVAVTGLLDKDRMDATARKQFAKETSKALEFLTRPFVFKYMRSPKEQRLRYQFEQTKRLFLKELHKGNITPERFDQFNKEINNILDQFEGKRR